MIVMLSAVTFLNCISPAGGPGLSKKGSNRFMPIKYTFVRVSKAVPIFWKISDTLNEQPDNTTCRSQRVLHFDLIGSRIQASGLLHEYTGGLKSVFERKLSSGLQLFAIFKPLNSWSRFGCDIKFEFHVRASTVFDLVKVLLGNFNLWCT